MSGKRRYHFGRPWQEIQRDSTFRIYHSAGKNQCAVPGKPQSFPAARIALVSLGKRDLLLRNRRQQGNRAGHRDNQDDQAPRRWPSPRRPASGAALEKLAVIAGGVEDPSNMHAVHGWFEIDYVVSYRKASVCPSREFRPQLPHFWIRGKQVTNCHDSLEKASCNIATPASGCDVRADANEIVLRIGRKFQSGHDQT
jgi:hypothetical protein